MTHIGSKLLLQLQAGSVSDTKAACFSVSSVETAIRAALSRWHMVLFVVSLTVNYHSVVYQADSVVVEMRV